MTTQRSSFITVTDQFCGAGGSSQGVRNFARTIGGGVEVKLALNHWKLAIETHETNFPDTLHDCTDISASDPRRYPKTTILITSPECTNHSLAKGQKQVKQTLDLFNKGVLDPAAERSRATMWDVPRFAEYHQYEAIIVENVVDARKWVMWDAWLQAMHLLGYNHRCVYLNSMHAHPTPQSRDRMYVVFWKKGNKAPNLDYTPRAHCPRCAADVLAVQVWKNPQKKAGKYKQQYLYACPVHGLPVEPYYYAAFNCIDWSDIGTRIGDRKAPLSDNTVRRIQYGLKKYGRQPLVLHTAYSDQARGVVRPVTEPAFTQTSFTSQAIATPFLVDDKQTTGVNFRVRGVKDVLHTVHTGPRVKIVMPFLAKLEHSRQDNVKPVNEPFATQTTRQSFALVSPYIVEMNRTGEAKPACNPCSTITAGGINHALLVENKGQSNSRPITDATGCVTTVPHLGILSTEAMKSFIHYNYGKTTLSAVDEPLGTATTRDRHSLVSYKEPVLEDCYYRMLKPHEIKLAMAFEHDYKVLGNGRDQVKQLGNAVTPPAMQWLVEQVVNSLS